MLVNPSFQIHTRGGACPPSRMCFGVFFNSRFFKILPLLLFLLSFTLRLQAQPSYQSQIETAMENLELQRAGELSFKEPSLKLRWYYQTRILFIRYLINEDATIVNTFFAHSKQGIQAIQALPDADPERDVMCAEMFFLRGIAKALGKKNLGSAIEFKSACSLIYNNALRFPENKEQLKLLGIFNVAMSAIPKKLQWLSSVLCFSGELNKGIRQLETAKRESRLLPAEADLMLFYFEKNLLGKPEAAVARAAKMVEARPKSILFHYLLLSGYLETRQIDKAIALVEAKEAQLLANNHADPLPIWHYTRAKAHFYRLEYAACIAQIDQFFSVYHGKTLFADALYKKGMALILADRYDEAKPVFLQLTKVEGSSFDVDEYARAQSVIYLLKPPSKTEKQLYEARNLFDGGYYQRSLDLLNPILQKESSISENERCELFYRLGRNHQELNRLDLARGHFEACISTQPGRSLWMKVYAHYYLGRLEEKEGHVAAAEAQYRIALTFDEYDYQSGLEQRSKAALHQLKGKKQP
jgi:tetratricopeptide (TPR) repeat protein